jgi:hypothetical protein
VCVCKCNIVRLGSYLVRGRKAVSVSCLRSERDPELYIHQTLDISHLTHSSISLPSIPLIRTQSPPLYSSAQSRPTSLQRRCALPSSFECISHFTLSLSVRLFLLRLTSFKTRLARRSGKRPLQYAACSHSRIITHRGGAHGSRSRRLGVGWV